MNKSILVYVTQLMETGGIESHVLEFCEQMRIEDVKIDIIVPNFKMHPKDEERIRKACNKVYLFRGKQKLSQIFWLIITISFFRKRFYDALYTNGQGESINILARIVRRKHWVHHHHTSGDEADQATWGKGYREALSKTNTLIACSRRNASDMKKVLFRKVEVIPCFSRMVLVREDHNEKRKKLRFGYYGRLIPEKGIDLICQLSEDSDLNEIEFHLWGKGSNYASTYFNNYSNIFYHGIFTNKEELQNVISSIDAYLLLSTHPEGLPISLLEVMSAGVPWLATDRGGISDIACDPLSTRLLSPDLHYNNIKNSILSLAADIRSGKISKSRQQQLYQENFSAQALVEKWSGALNIN